MVNNFKPKIKVGYLVSYDYHFLLTSLKQIYDHVDEIFLAIDQDRKTWSGNYFDIPPSFFEEINTYDTKKIINFYYDNFYVPGLKPIDCETRERNILLQHMGRGWLIQLDVDEYIYDFKNVAKYLRSYWYLTLFPKITPLTFKGKLITLYRQVPDGFLYINNKETFTFITNQKEFSYVRKNNKIRNHYSNICVIHQSWARTENEIRMKINNWGHKTDFDTQEYFEFWKNLSIENYREFENIHPISPTVWSKLYCLPSKSIDDFISKFSQENPQKLIPINFKTMLEALKRKLWRRG